MNRGRLLRVTDAGSFQRGSAKRQASRAKSKARRRSRGQSVGVLRPVLGMRAGRMKRREGKRCRFDACRQAMWASTGKATAASASKARGCPKVSMRATDCRRGTEHELASYCLSVPTRPFCLLPSFLHLLRESCSACPENGAEHAQGWHPLRGFRTRRKLRQDLPGDAR